MDGSYGQFRSNHVYPLNSYTFSLISYKLVLSVHLSLLHSHRLKCNCRHIQVRMYFGSFWVETDWKETLPRRQLSEPPTAKTYKRTECVFVQVFHIGPVPDIFLNKTKWRTIFGITTFFSSLKGPVRFRGLQTPASLLRNSSAGTTVLRLCPRIITNFLAWMLCM